MKKQADWKAQLAKALQDKRLVGALLAGTAGGVVGGFGLPGLVWKKPTKKQRILTGGTTAALAALATAAAMGEGQKQDPGEKAVSDIGKAFSNLGSIISGDRPTVDELREMGPVARTLKGYGSNVPAWLVRRIRGIFPDWEGLGGKSQKAKQREAAGELPKIDDDPSAALAWGKLFTNTGIGGYTGWKHYKNLVSRFQQKELAKKLVQQYKNIEPSKLVGNVDPAVLKVLDKWSNPTPLIQKGVGVRGNIKNIWNQLLTSLKHKGQAIASNNTFGLAKPFIGDISYNKALNSSALRDKLVRDLHGNNAFKDFRSSVAGLSAKPSFGRKLWYGTRGAGRGLFMAALAGAAQELLGANQTQNLDTARDLYADLKK